MAYRVFDLASITNLICLIWVEKCWTRSIKNWSFGPSSKLKDQEHYKQFQYCPNNTIASSTINGTGEKKSVRPCYHLHSLRRLPPVRRNWVCFCHSVCWFELWIKMSNFQYKIHRSFQNINALLSCTKLVIRVFFLCVCVLMKC